MRKQVGLSEIPVLSCKKIIQFIYIRSTITGCAYSAKTHMFNMTNATEDYGCSNYKFLMLDCIASCCDLGAMWITFLSKNDIMGFTFGGCTTYYSF